MKLLCFQAKRFRWKTHSKTLAEVADQDIDREVGETVVVFLHAEAADGNAERTATVLRQSLKHIKWLANKRGLRNVVLHSFSHLGGITASAALAESLMTTLQQRLSETGYQVWTTPFGYFCEWDLSVYGESLAKVWKEIH
ncbi:MAG TPA: threonyl-tRNA synthetase editing domain-containing protein [Candidatus Deferrimicrobium sp.]|nr:threonyl-tRNA synthetase editing domain-containing protein [Candidatus Deferrimicrobium sp.]